VGIWAPDAASTEELVAAATESGADVTTLDTDAELVQFAYHQEIDLLIALDDERLLAQERFIRTPLLLVRNPHRPMSLGLARTAYSVARSAGEVSLAIDRFGEHRRLSSSAAQRRHAPAKCSRCGLVYDPASGHDEPETRFVRFGSVALCGGCVGELRNALRAATGTLVDVDSSSQSVK
jgi:hypothetical protein